MERYHAGRVEVTGFKVADAAVEGRYEDALRLLRHALATGVDPVPVNAAFAAGLRTLAKVGGASRSARPDDIARDLGLAPFQVKKARGQLAGWTPDGVAAGILAVARADEQIKGGGTDPVYALERAVGRDRQRAHRLTITAAGSSAPRSCLGQVRAAAGNEEGAIPVGGDAL